MSSSISSMPAAPPPVASPNPQQLAQLNRLVSKYKGDLSRDVATRDLSSLARQIATAANALGQHVALPRASNAQAPASGGSSAPAATSTRSGSGGVNVTA